MTIINDYREFHKTNKLNSHKLTNTQKEKIVSDILIKNYNDNILFLWWKKKYYFNYFDKDFTNLDDESKTKSIDIAGNYYLLPLVKLNKINDEINTILNE